jgi:outer membrane receptor protein involved in Fe transport
VETLIDRKVYNVKSDMQSAFGTLGDVLNAIPSIDVDPDGVVSLRGDSNVLILIDGKPSPQFSGPAAGDNIQSLPAMDIERIEVMTTPPAQFKADGAAGVINIVTRKTRPKGLTGTAQASVGSSGRANAATNLSYVSGPTALSLAAGFRHDYRARLIASDVRVPAAASGMALESRSALEEQIHREVPSLGLSAKTALDDRQSLSGSVDWSERGGLRTYLQSNAGLGASGAIDSLAQRMSRGHDPEFNNDERLGYAKAFDGDGEKLDVTLHRTTSRQREHYDYTDDSFVPAAAAASSSLNLLDDQATTQLDADYALALSKSRSLKLGYAFEQDDSRFGSFGTMIDPVSGNALVDPAVSHDFEYRQQIEAAYASLQGSAGAWNGLAGLRAEFTRTDADQLTDGLSHRAAYFGLFPSMHLDRSISDAASLWLGASRRLSRPDPGNLDPYVDHEYAPNLRAGNAGLQPQTTQSYEFGYDYDRQGLRYQASGYFRRNHNSITDLTQYLGNGISLTTKTNLPRNDATGIELTAAGDLTRRLACSLSSNLFHSQIDATALGMPGLRSTDGINAKLKLDFRATAADAVQLLATRTDKRLTPQGYVGAIDLVNAGYRHRFGRGLSAVATLTDIFNGQRSRRIESTPDFSGDYVRAVRGRVLYVGVVYSFGAAAKGKEARLEYDTSD